MATTRKSPIQVVVLGEPRVGKTSLITAASVEVFPQTPPPVLPPTWLSAETFPDRTLLKVIDTSSRAEDRSELETAIRQSDVALVCFAMNDLRTLDALRQYWIPEIRRISATKPIVVVGCRSDEATKSTATIALLVEPLLEDFQGQVEIVTQCSARKLQYVLEAFQQAIKAVKYPLDPLWDHARKELKRYCIMALRRVFMMVDVNRDGLLDDAELELYQRVCYDTELHQKDLELVKQASSGGGLEAAAPAHGCRYRRVQDSSAGCAQGCARLCEKELACRRSRGVGAVGGVQQWQGDNAVTLKGFLFLHAVHIERGRMDNVWMVLDAFGYGQDLQLRPPLFHKLEAAQQLLHDQAFELSPAGHSFLHHVFSALENEDGALSQSQLDELFSTTPQPPGKDAGLRNLLVQRSAAGNLTRTGFIAFWGFLAASNPKLAVASLLYIGYKGPLFGRPGQEWLQAAAEELVKQSPRRRQPNERRADAQRTYLSVGVYGSRGSGKSTLLRRWVGLRCDGVAVAEEAVSVDAAHILALPGGAERLLLCRECSEEGLEELLGTPAGTQQLQQHDVALFLFDSTSTGSFRRAASSMIRLAEATKHLLPCMFVAAKDDRPVSEQLSREIESTCTELCLPQPCPCSAIVGEGVPEVFQRVVEAAAAPETYIPETPARKAAREYQRLLQRIALAAVACVAGYGFYAAAVRISHLAAPPPRSSSASETPASALAAREPPPQLPRAPAPAAAGVAAPAPPPPRPSLLDWALTSWPRRSVALPNGSQQHPPPGPS